MAAPDQKTMSLMLSHLFSDQMRGMIELAWTNPNEGAPRHAQLFTLDAIDELADKAAALNTERRNIYIGAALRKENTPPFSRTNGEDFFLAPALWADLDDAGGAVRAAETCKALGVRPTMVVFTGHHPHDRCQLWWRLDQPLQDAAQVKLLLGQIQTRLGSDAAVVDPSRIMRLAGTVAWPIKSGRIAELTEWQPVNGAHFYGLERLKAVFAAPQQSDDGDAQFDSFFGLDEAELIANASVPGKRHASKLRLVGHWVALGYTDAAIMLMGEGIGHDSEATRQKFVKMIVDARTKWNKPNPTHAFQDTPAEPQRAIVVEPEKVSCTGGLICRADS
jgi:hypothetical protein